MTTADYYRYLRKSGDDHIVDENLTVNEHGFASWQVWNNKLVIINCYGDGEYWDKYFTEKAREMGLDAVMFATYRSPKGFERKYRYRLTGYLMEKEV